MVLREGVQYWTPAVAVKTIQQSTQLRNAQRQSHKSRRKQPAPGKASKPGKLQQKGITAFLRKPQQSSAEPEEQTAALKKEPKPVQASQDPVRQQHHILLLTSH